MNVTSLAQWRIVDKLGLRGQILVAPQRLILYFILFLQGFQGGAGIDFPHIFLIGNLGYADILSIFYLLFLALKNRLELLVSSVFLASLALACWIAVAWCFSLVFYPEYFRLDSAGYVFRIWYYAVLVGVLPTLIGNRMALLTVILGLMAGLLCLTAVNWYRWNQEPIYHWSHLPLLTGREFNPNTFGYYLSVISPIFFGLIIMFKDIWYSKVLIPVFLFLIFSAFNTISKGAWVTIIITIVISTIFQFILSPGGPSKRILWAICLAILLVGFNPDFLNTVQSRWKGSRRSNDQRVEMVYTSVNIWAKSPIIGFGPKSFLTAQERHEIGTLSRDPHHTLAGLLSEVGFFSAIFLVIVFILNFSYLRTIFNELRSFRYGKIEEFLFISLLSIYLSNILISNTTGLPFSEKIYWIGLILTLSFRRILVSPVDRSIRKKTSD